MSDERMRGDLPERDDLPERHPAAAYTLELPVHPRPIVVIGAGGIVKDAHLPAYRKAGYPVWGIVNRTVQRADALAAEFGIEHVFGTVEAAVAEAPADAVYDIALMPEQYEAALEALPDGSPVLIQKPLGHSLEQGEALAALCRRKGLVAAVNTQLRFAPYVAEARRLIAAGTIGEVHDMEVRVSVDTPWHLFPHVFGMERLELTMHSVHYLDLVRSFFGDPDGVSAVTRRHPGKPEIATTRSTIILRYRGRDLRAVVSTNHDHDYGPAHEESFIKWEGTRGAIRAQLGLLLDYPRGREDSLELAVAGEKGWTPLPFEGSWFPDAFIGSMGALQRYVEGSVDSLPTSVDDVLHTMAVVEAAYESDEREGVPLRVTVTS
ncbi:Gfo/Idh/MocA family protein [Herbiconiux flava]|uniref:Putative dehydrogenase n=1 Tax=Herbiconiux flava TaxID=881268 RepID=A0A852SNI5_9MICO|nr:Gfo/Idh/MocA family oxidoreductase [Herbiconiux flava]NYD70382.1 putative dehydrogenase [Herbiconiux flava]GLK17138.1 oxidoreductase [Herbiconiux flava]